MPTGVEKAIRHYEASQQRTARGSVDGFNVTIVKKHFLMFWAVYVTVEGETWHRYWTLSKRSAENEFNHLTNVHDLEEQ
jgi:hypothetical protein